jgi:glycosyltransferase involved in cell wall biosynthesis
MDRAVPPRVTYWTGTWDPEKEAISKEVDTLRTMQTDLAPVVAFSPGNRSRIHPRRRVITMSSRRWLLFRGLAACLEPTADISHVFGALDSWHALRSLGRRPIVLTLVAAGEPVHRALYDKVRVFVSESPRIAQTLADLGIPAERIRVIYPGVNLSRFPVVAPPEHGPFRILFASWPEESDQIDGRGIPLLIELARHRRDIQVVLLRRPWGDVAGTTRAVEALGLPANVSVEELGSRSMADLYAGVHATAALFKPGYGKATPASLLESLACGRPVLMTGECGIADPVASAGAGLQVRSTVDAAVAAIERLQDSWTQVSSSARALAERAFDERRFVSDYASLYSEICSTVPKRSQPLVSPSAYD